MTAARLVKDTPVARLKPHPANPRTISRDALERLKKTLTADPEMLQARPLIALPDGTVIAGNQRLRAALELGWKTIPVATVDLDEQTARTWMLRDNAAFGDWDWAAVGDLLDGLDPELAGFAALDLDGIAAATEARRGRPDPDVAPPAPVEPRSQRGELYELGPHRLMCGDATDQADVTALVAGRAARVLVTDPPYGVSVDHTWRDGLRQPIGAARTGLVANDDRFEWEAAYQLTDAPVAYVWHSALYAGEVKAGLKAAGYIVRQQIVWVKTVHAIGRAAYQWRHETCWYAVRKGGKAGWRGGRKQSTVIEAASPIMAYGGGQDDQRSPHPTQKPIAVFEPPIVNHTVAGDCVYDPFAGSGTVMIAADKTGRVALMMELDPAYCDVIRDRWDAWNAA